MSVSIIEAGMWGGREWSRVNFAQSTGPAKDFIDQHREYMRQKIKPFPLLAHFDACQTHGFIERVITEKAASIIDPRTGAKRRTSLSTRLVTNYQFVVYHFIDGPRIDLVMGYIYNTPIFLLYHDTLAALVINETSMMGELDLQAIARSCLEINLVGSGFHKRKPIQWTTADVNSVGHSYWQNLSALDFFERSGLITQIDTITPHKYDFFGLSRYMRGTNRLRVVEGGDYLHVAFSDLYIRKTVSETMHEIIPDEVWLRHQPEHSAPIVMFQLRATQRSWLGQVEGISNIINVLSSKYPGMEFVVDGMSKLVDDDNDDKEVYADELRIYNEICSKVGSHVKVDTVIGWEIPDKMARLAHMWVFCAPIGSGFIIPHWVLNKRGVTYGPPAMYGWTLDHAEYCNEGLRPLSWFPPESVRPDGREEYARNSAFDLDWRQLLDLLIKEIEGARAELGCYWSRYI